MKEEKGSHLVLPKEGREAQLLCFSSVVFFFSPEIKSRDLKILCQQTPSQPCYLYLIFICGVEGF
jgi:hypothetical protein